MAKIYRHVLLYPEDIAAVVDWPTYRRAVSLFNLRTQKVGGHLSDSSGFWLFTGGRVHDRLGLTPFVINPTAPQRELFERDNHFCISPSRSFMIERSEGMNTPKTLDKDLIKKMTKAIKSFSAVAQNIVHFDFLPDKMHVRQMAEMTIELQEVRYKRTWASIAFQNRIHITRKTYIGPFEDKEEAALYKLTSLKSFIEDGRVSFDDNSDL